MAIGTTLGRVVEMVRNEARLSSNSSRGTDLRESIVETIKRHYELLADEHDWSHLRLRHEEGQKTCAAGQKYYDFPVRLNTLKIDKLFAQFNANTWLEVDYGIDPSLYNIFNSPSDSRRDPPLRWQRRDDNQFEIWPVPMTDSALMVFTGYRKVNPLVDDSSQLEMDDRLVALFVAGEFLTGTKQPDAQVKLAAANKRLQQLMAGENGKKRVRVGMQSVHEIRPQQFRSTLYVRS